MTRYTDYQVCPSTVMYTSLHLSTLTDYSGDVPTRLLLHVLHVLYSYCGCFQKWWYQNTNIATAARCAALIQEPRAWCPQQFQANAIALASLCSLFAKVNLQGMKAAILIQIKLSTAAFSSVRQHLFLPTLLLPLCMTCLLVL